MMLHVWKPGKKEDTYEPETACGIPEDNLQEAELEGMQTFFEMMFDRRPDLCPTCRTFMEGWYKQHGITRPNTRLLMVRVLEIGFKVPDSAPARRFRDELMRYGMAHRKREDNTYFQARTANNCPLCGARMKYLGGGRVGCCSVKVPACWKVRTVRVGGVRPSEDW